MDKINYELKLFGLPKISLNEWYAGKHWTARKRIKDAYKLLIKGQTHALFPKNKTYDVEYTFIFKSNPLDASNTVAMAKMIEDVLFEDDKYNIVLSVKYKSRKGKANIVIVEICENSKS